MYIHSNYRYAKYRLRIPELKILYDANRPEVVQFATLKQGYTVHNYVAHAANCVYTTGVSIASYTFDIRGNEKAQVISKVREKLHF